MNDRHSDASTSTEDMKGRPLCLYYFTHPFGVLSPEPPRVTAFVPEDAGTPGGVDVVRVPGGCTLELGELSACSWFSAMLSRDMWGDVGRTAGGRLLPPLRLARAPPAPAPGTPQWQRPGGWQRESRSKWLPPLPAPPAAPPRQPAARRQARVLRKLTRRVRRTAQEVNGRVGKGRPRRKFIEQIGDI